MTSSNERAALARRALLDTLRVANLLDRKGGALARTEGITSAQWLSLGLLVRVGDRGMTPTELCRQLCVSKQNMTGMILRLEKKGLVSRRPEAHDRRSFRVLVTPAGHKIAASLEPGGREFFLAHVTPLGDGDLSRFADALALVLDVLRSPEDQPVGVLAGEQAEARGS